MQQYWLKPWTNFLFAHVRCENELAHKDFKKAVGAIRIVYSPEQSELIVLVSPN